MSESATAYAEDIQNLGEKIVGLTLKQAKELSDYLKDVHGIEAAAGGAVVMAAPTEGAAAAVVEKTEFDVVLTAFGDKKLDIVKIVKNLTGLSLIDSKKLVEGVPSKIKEQISKEDAEKIKKELTEAGATVELK
ncbi:MAG: 50S ribosomal protein L7/L12 [Planctomycetota bacterium]|jgi:large subunit ribosomal protein L7/L12